MAIIETNQTPLLLEMDLSIEESTCHKCFLLPTDFWLKILVSADFGDVEFNK